MTQDITAIVDPDAYVSALRQARQVLVQKLATQQVELHLLTGSPVWTDEEREPSVRQLEKLLEDLTWRIGEVDSALEAFDEVREIVTLPRAERDRRLAEIRVEKTKDGATPGEE